MRSSLIVTSVIQHTLHRLPQEYPRRVTIQPAHLFIAAWLITTISIPILRWVVGDGVLHQGVIAGVLLQTAAVLAISYQAWGTRTVLRIAAIVIALSWAIERVGSTTGIPFGPYHYTEALAPLVGGVPAVIAPAWLMMLVPAWAVAYAITGSVRGWRFVLVSALAFTAWDLFLDPQMVAWGYWVWEIPGIYFGIPLVNYTGWLLASALLTAIARPPRLPLAPLLFIYGAVWFLQSVGLAIFWQMPGPALFGFAGMGFFVLWSLRSMRRQKAKASNTQLMGR